MDLDNIAPAPDIDNLDLDKLDFGHSAEPPAPEPAAEPPAPEPEPEKVDGAEAEPEAGTVADTGREKPSRDDKGRFTEARIPKERFDEAVGKEREAREAAERRAAELERQLQMREKQERNENTALAYEAEIEKLESQHAELLLDGNVAEATKVMRQIRTMERQIAVAEAEERAATRTAQALESDRMQATIARIEATHPEMNPQSEVYDQDLIDLVLTKQRGFVEQGLSPSQAIEKAASYVADRFLKKAAPEVSPKGLEAGRKEDGRKQQAVEKALAVQQAQPSSVKEVGMDSDKLGEKGLPDVSRMTADEFAALPEATQARLMGNLV